MKLTKRYGQHFQHATKNVIFFTFPICYCFWLFATLYAIEQTNGISFILWIKFWEVCNNCGFVIKYWTYNVWQLLRCLHCFQLLELKSHKELINLHLFAFIESEKKGKWERESNEKWFVYEEKDSMVIIMLFWRRLLHSENPEIYNFPSSMNNKTETYNNNNHLSKRSIKKNNIYLFIYFFFHKQSFK